MHVGIAEQRELDDRALAVDLLGDGGDVRRGGDLRVGKVERQAGIEVQRQPFLVEDGRDAGAIGQLEHVARKRRLRGRAHADRRAFLGGACRFVLPQQPLGLLRALGQFLDDVRRQRWRRAAPGIGQQVDEQALARHHDVRCGLACQRQAECAAVGIDAGGADEIGSALPQLVDRDVDRADELDDDNHAGGSHFRVDLPVQFDDEARIVAPFRQRRLRP